MSWSQEELVAAAYAVVFVFVLVYVAIIAANLARVQRETAELVELVLSRPLPVQLPTAFVRIRPRGMRLCGDARPRRSRRCAPTRTTAKRS